MKKGDWVTINVKDGKWGMRAKIKITKFDGGFVIGKNDLGELVKGKVINK